MLMGKIDIIDTNQIYDTRAGFFHLGPRGVGGLIWGVTSLLGSLTPQWESDKIPAQEYRNWQDSAYGMRIRILDIKKSEFLMSRIAIISVSRAIQDHHKHLT
jgi:hypothetical protein